MHHKSRTTILQDRKRSVELTSRHGSHTLLLHLRNGPLQQTPRTRAQTLTTGFTKTDQEEGHIVLPRDTSIRAEIHLRQDIPITILQTANLQLFEIRLIVHVPAEDDGAEAEARLGDGEEFLLGHEFAAHDAVDVDAAHFDADIVLQELGEVGVGEFMEMRRVVGLGHGGFGLGRVTWRCFDMVVQMS